MRKTTRISALVGLVLSMTTLAAAKIEEVSRDDGKPDERRSSAGVGHAVRFVSPREGFIITGVRVHGSRYGRGYDPYLTVARVGIFDMGMRPLAETFVPYSAWTVGKADWVEIPIGPTRAPKGFYATIELFPTATSGVYVSIDEDNHSDSFVMRRQGSSPPAVSNFSEGQWMIRVIGTTREEPTLAADSEAAVALGHGDAEPTDKRSIAGSGHAVRFQAPRPVRQPVLTRISVCGALYGGGFDPGSTFFNVFVCDRRLEVIARSSHPYALFRGGDLAWVDIDVPPTRVPKDFYVVVCFDPTARRGVYVGLREEPRGGFSMTAYPGDKGKGKGERLADKGMGWAIRATVAPAREGSIPLLDGKAADAAEPTSDLDEPAGMDAAELAQIREQLDDFERDEDIVAANALVRTVAKKDPDAAAALGAFETSDHFLLRRVGLGADQGRSLLALMESAHRSLTKRFGFTEVSGVPGRRIHLHVTVSDDDAASPNLFTSPSSPDYSLIVFRGPTASLRPPGQGGVHHVYGWCHELGHVLIGWEDSRHQWAHYIGSLVVEDVYRDLGEDAWFEPYDSRPEGLSRFRADIEGVEPGRDSDAAVAALFHQLGERFGTETLGPAIRWIRENRAGKPFHSVKLYKLDDLGEAMCALQPAKADEIRRLLSAR